MEMIPLDCESIEITQSYLLADRIDSIVASNIEEIGNEAKQLEKLFGQIFLEIELDLDFDIQIEQDRLFRSLEMLTSEQSQSSLETQFDGLRRDFERVQALIGIAFYNLKT